jgi:hypothetical protein
MILAGTLMSVVAEGRSDLWVIAQRVGLGLTVAGIVGLFTEFAFGPYWLRGPDRPVRSPSEGTMGMQLISTERTGFSGFHSWVLDLQPQDLFFAGRSVLHRMKKDFTDRGLQTIPQTFVHQMSMDSRIRILFMNPNWGLIEEIAKQEGRSNPRELYADLRDTLGVVNELWQLLQNDKRHLPGMVDIRVYEEITQYAYHYVSDRKTSATTMYVGFYFAELVGYRSALFSVESEQVRDAFGGHFAKLFDKAKPLLTYSSGGSARSFNQAFYDETMAFLDRKVDGSVQ